MSVGFGAALAPLSALREELRLFTASANRDGSPAWMIQDPVGNRFFRIGWPEFEVLSRWHLRDPRLIAAAINRETSLRVSPQQVIEVAEFFRGQQLLAVRDAQGVAHLTALQQRGQLSYWKWLLHHYLFIRIPLVHPQRFLNWLAPLCGLFYTRAFVVAAISATVIGLLLAIRQWETFVGTFVNTMSATGLLGWGLALICAKALHELGHAVTATRQGQGGPTWAWPFSCSGRCSTPIPANPAELPRREDRFRIAATAWPSSCASQVCHAGLESDSRQQPAQRAVLPGHDQLDHHAGHQRQSVHALRWLLPAVGRARSAQPARAQLRARPRGAASRAGLAGASPILNRSARRCDASW
ncbi:MAG: hypothetical protein R3E68_01190 [Burkholderiaceae bacterium]